MHHANLVELELCQPIKAGEGELRVFGTYRQLQPAPINASIGGKQHAAMALPKECQLALAMARHVDCGNVRREGRLVAVFDRRSTITGSTLATRPASSFARSRLRRPGDGHIGSRMVVPASIIGLSKRCAQTVAPVSRLSSAALPMWSG